MRRLVLVSVALFFVWGCVAPQPKGPRENPLVARGIEFLAKGSERLDRGCFSDAAGDFTLAYQDFQASDHLGGMASALNNLAVAHLNLGDDQKAELFASRALALNRNLGDPLGQAANISVLGGVHLSRGEDGDALKLWNDALKSAKNGPAPLRARIHNDIGVALMRAGKSKEAKEHLDTALGLTPNSAAVHLNLGKVARASGQDSRAEELYKKALDIDRESGYAPGIAVDLTELGTLYLETKRREEAAELLARALALRELLNQDARADELRELLSRAGMEVRIPGERETNVEPPPACR